MIDNRLSLFIKDIISDKIIYTPDPNFQKSVIIFTSHFVHTFDV